MTEATSKKDFVVYQKCMVLQLHSWVKYNTLDRAQGRSPNCSFYSKFWPKIQGRKALFLELLETFSEIEFCLFCTLAGLFSGIME